VRRKGGQGGIVPGGIIVFIRINPFTTGLILKLTTTCGQELRCLVSTDSSPQYKLFEGESPSSSGKQMYKLLSVKQKLE